MSVYLERRVSKSKGGRARVESKSRSVREGRKGRGRERTRKQAEKEYREGSHVLFESSTYLSARAPFSSRHKSILSYPYFASVCTGQRPDAPLTSSSELYWIRASTTGRWFLFVSSR